MNMLHDYSNDYRAKDVLSRMNNKTNPTNPELDDLIWDLIGECVIGREWVQTGFPENFEAAEMSTTHLHEKIAALLEKEALKARAEELTHVQLEHGNYVTQTWFRLKAYTIKERIEQLTKQLGSK